MNLNQNHPGIIDPIEKKVFFAAIESDPIEKKVFFTP